MDNAISLLNELAAKPADVLASEIRDMSQDRRKAYMECLNGLANVETLQET